MPSHKKHLYFTKKKILAHYLLYATVVTYLPVFGTVVFQFPCRVFFYGLSAENEKKQNLVTVHPPKGQIFNQNESCCLVLQYYRIQVLSFFLYMTMATTLKVTRRYRYICQREGKNMTLFLIIDDI